MVFEERLAGQLESESHKSLTWLWVKARGESLLRRSSRQVRQDGGVGWGGHGQTQKWRIGFVILTTHGGKKVESNIRNGAQVWQSRAQVVNFLCWAAEPAHDERKLIGLKAEVGCGGPLHRMRRHAGVTGLFHDVLHAGPCGGHVRLLCRDIHCRILVPQYVDRADALRDVKQ